MGITVMFYPYDSLKQDYSDIGVPVTFGEMNTEFYNIINKGDSVDTTRSYGFYVDNVITQGSNILQTFSHSDVPATAFGFSPSDFTSYTYPSGPDKSLIFKYKITDTLFADVHQSIIFSHQRDDGRMMANFSMDIQFYSTLTTHKFTIGFPFFVPINEKIYLNYEEFIDLNHGLNPFGYWVTRGYFYGVNAFPNSPELVEASVSTTGCIIQSFVIYPKITSSGSPYSIFQLHTNVYGINGTDVTAWHNDNATRFYVPEILGYGYVPEFPSSAEDNFVGSYNNDSDEGDIPPLPEQSAVRSGMVRLYQMTTTQLNAFAKFLWNTSLTDFENLVSTLKQWFSNPLDSIISLTISPIDMFYNYNTKTASKPEASNIKLGGFDTGVQGHLCSNNYVQISLGTISLIPYYKSFLDCNPHTKFSLYLPYIGFKDIDADTIFSKGGTAIEIVYSIDVLSGVCVANILIEKESNNTKLKHVLYTFAGNMNTTIPISSANMKDFISASVGAVASGVGMMASGGTITPIIMGSMLADQGLNVASQKMNVSHSGGMSLESGMFGIQYAYLIVTRPREARPSNYRTLNGVPSEISGKLVTFSGFTQVSSVNVHIPNATEEEKNEIEKLLKEGVIL